MDPFMAYSKQKMYLFTDKLLSEIHVFIHLIGLPSFPSPTKIIKANHSDLSI